MNIKKEKGSISMFVLVGLLFMSTILILLYGGSINKSKDLEEKFKILKSIYSYGDEDSNAYNRAKTALRNKNKKIETASVENNSSIELTNSFSDKAQNYRIYGSENTNVGDLVTDSSDENYEKYKISIKATNSDNENKTINIYVNEPLKENEYIDFKTQKIYKNDGTEESITLPKLSIYEDYTKIEILTTAVPEKIEIEYESYTL